MGNAADALPRDFDALRQQILAQRDDLPKRIAQIAAHALDNPDDIAFGTAASIASSAGVQPSTLIRFAKHFGFDGFTSMQLLFRERLRGRIASYEERLAEVHAVAQGAVAERTILEGFAAAAHRSLDGLALAVSDEALQRAVEILSKARTIYIVARRRSYPAATAMAYAMGKLGIRSLLVESPAGLTPETLSFATPADAAVAISFSPYAGQTVDEAKTLRAAQVPVVAITDSAFSPLAQFAEVWFEVAESDFGGFRSLTATMVVATAIAVAIADRRRASDVPTEHVFHIDSDGTKIP